MADDIDIEAMLEAPYRKVRKIRYIFLISEHSAFKTTAKKCKLTPLEIS